MENSDVFCSNQMGIHNLNQLWMLSYITDVAWQLFFDPVGAFGTTLDVDFEIPAPESSQANDTQLSYEEILNSRFVLHFYLKKRAIFLTSKIKINISCNQ